MHTANRNRNILVRVACSPDFAGDLCLARNSHPFPNGEDNDGKVRKCNNALMLMDANALISSSFIKIRSERQTLFDLTEPFR